MSFIGPNASVPTGWPDVPRAARYAPRGLTVSRCYITFPAFKQPNTETTILRKFLRQLNGFFQPSVPASKCTFPLFVSLRLIGITRQRAPTAHAPQAAAARALPFGLLRLVGLLPLRRRHAGIVRCLRWLAEFGLEFRNSPLRHIKALPQRSDQRILLGVAQKSKVGWRGHPALRIDATVTLSTNFLPSGAVHRPRLPSGPLPGMSKYPSRAATSSLLAASVSCTITMNKSFI